MEHVKVSWIVIECVNTISKSVGPYHPAWKSEMTPVHVEITFHTCNVYCGWPSFSRHLVFPQTLPQPVLNYLFIYLFIYVTLNLNLCCSAPHNGAKWASNACHLNALSFSSFTYCYSLVTDRAVNTWIRGFLSPTFVLGSCHSFRTRGRMELLGHLMLFYRYATYHQILLSSSLSLLLTPPGLSM